MCHDLCFRAVATIKVGVTVELRVAETTSRSSRPEVSSGKVVLKISSKFAGEHPYWGFIPVNVLRKFIEITLRHGCSSVSLLHISRTPFHKNTSGGLLPDFLYSTKKNHRFSIISPLLCRKTCWSQINLPGRLRHKRIVFYRISKLTFVYIDIIDIKYIWPSIMLLVFSFFFNCHRRFWV